MIDLISQGQGRCSRHCPSCQNLVAISTYDDTWAGYDSWLWTSFKSDLAIICTCAPALKPFFSRCLGGSASSSNTSPYAINSRGRIDSTAPENSLSHSASRDVELDRSIDENTLDLSKTIKQ